MYAEELISRDEMIMLLEVQLHHLLTLCEQDVFLLYY